VIVVDASVVIELLLRSPDAAAIQERIFGGGELLHAPHLMDVEVAQVMRRYSLRGEITAARGALALDILRRLPVRRHAHDLLLDRIWELRTNMTAYDAAYVALAEGLGATLVTRDAALSRAPGVRALVEIV
jgi:predicted nucleic acid-binding protein